ncbi:unnamed protein product [Soboliphyme baturini]|uniref:MEKK4_N domain-containing protein n=1 Tax=Soboliphyme baturini TaxID=241478 RepID=A0A183J844_9BILA|nr:unnamed protein product [Soboliphyme baturini]
MENVLRCKTALIDLDDSEKTTYRDTLMQAYNFVFEYHRGLSKLMTGALKREFAVALKGLAHQWINFVLNVCEPGHCCRPRWANDGLNFLAFSVSPKYSIHLTSLEYQELKDVINRCIVHVIGTRTPIAVVPRIHSWDCNLSCSGSVG